MRRLPKAFVCTLLVLLLPGTPTSYAQQLPPQTPTSLDAARKAAIERGLAYLAQNGQASDGTFTAESGSGITSLALTAALRNGRSVDDPLVAKGLKAMENFVKPDGGIYGGGRLKNYETCVAMVCLVEANADGRYNETLRRAKEFVTGMQYGAAGDVDESNPWYGGSSYSGVGRPDLSNTSFMIDALNAMDVGPNDPAIQRALQFVSRCQNLDSKHNDTAFAPLVNDGGFYYEIPLEKVDPSTSPERFTPAGGLRSYGSITYAGLKSMVYAGLTADDPRVKAALDWIAQHYTLEQNPGMGDAGLYFYYHTFGAALHAAAKDKITDAAGVEHPWRADLTKALAAAQNLDGSWSNANQRWLEADKNLATSLALIALSYCEPQLQPQSQPAGN